MLDELQLLAPDKKRESDVSIRIMLLECLLAISSTVQGREYLRSIQVYAIVKMMHSVETNDQVIEMIENLVDLLMRDEAEDGNVVGDGDVGR